MAADGTQDTFLVRIGTDNGLDGWGESDASPLVSMAVYCCPPSHSNIINIRDTILGERVESPEDIRRIHAKVLRQALDIQHVHHAYSGADIALWDVLGKHLGQPVYELLDGPVATAHPKRPYASMLFGETPAETAARAQNAVAAGFSAAKFGWGPMGRAGAEEDIALVAAAREGLGKGAGLFVDAGVAWGADYETAYKRAVEFSRFDCGWLEEPLFPDAVEAYHRLAAMRPPVPIAAGEGSGRYRDAEDIVVNGGISYVQIDAGRIGGITPAWRVRKLAEERGSTYVNHTYKSHLSLAAALHVFACAGKFELLEYPVCSSGLAASLVKVPLGRGEDGLVRAPEKPGLGVEVDPAAVQRYMVPVLIEAGGEIILDSPGRSRPPVKG